MGCRYWVFGLFVLMVASFAPAVRADDLDACGNANPDIRISGCSAIIDAGTASREIVANAYINRGVAYDSKGEYDRAIEDYDKAIALNPNDASFYYNRGNTYDYKGEYDRAITDYDQAIALDPKLAPAYGNRGLVYARKGENDRAIMDFNKAIALEPEYAMNYFYRGLAYEKLGDKQKAEPDYQKTLSLLPGDKSAVAGLQRLKAAP